MHFCHLCTFLNLLCINTFLRWPTRTIFFFRVFFSLLVSMSFNSGTTSMFCFFFSKRTFFLFYSLALVFLVALADGLSCLVCVVSLISSSISFFFFFVSIAIYHKKRLCYIIFISDRIAFQKIFSTAFCCKIL